MNDEIESISDAIRDAVNIHGELHLDAVKTALLIRWIEKSESWLKQYESLGDKIARLVEDHGA